MALVKMGMGAVLLAALLAILFSAAAVHSCMNNRPATASLHRHASESSSPSPSSSSSSTSSRYRTYIVLLLPPKDADAMDKDAHRRWHQSFLPSTLTDSGEPRLRHSYTGSLNGFSARLTDDELEAVTKKPGFVRAFPNRVRYLDDMPTYYWRRGRRAGNVE